VERRTLDVVDFLRRSDYLRRPPFFWRRGLSGGAIGGIQPYLHAWPIASAEQALALDGFCVESGFVPFGCSLEIYILFLAAIVFGSLKGEMSWGF
jgi:hypothetical protein